MLLLLVTILLVANAVIGELVAHEWQPLAEAADA